MKFLVLASASVLAFATPAMAQDYNNASFVQQIGNVNTSTVDQNSGIQKSAIHQLSSNDTALVEQNGALNDSIVLQQGTEFVKGGNLSENRMSGEGDKNYVVQSGANNVSYTTFSPSSSNSVSLINQDGAGNFADYTSTGDSNESVISQQFDQNSASVFQMSSNNYSYVGQNGLGNAATVTQH